MTGSIELMVMYKKKLHTFSGDRIVQIANFYRGPLECIRDQYRIGGISACYRGFVIQFFRDIPASMTYFIVYEKLKEAMTKHGLTDSRGIIADFFAGGVAGTVSWAVIMPLDVVKNTFQAKMGSHTVSVFECVAHIYQEKGLRGFLTGLVVASVRAFLVNAVTFVAYSQTSTYLKSSQSQD